MQRRSYKTREYYQKLFVVEKFDHFFTKILTKYVFPVLHKKLADIIRWSWWMNRWHTINNHTIGSNVNVHLLVLIYLIDVSIKAYETLWLHIIYYFFFFFEVAILCKSIVHSFYSPLWGYWTGAIHYPYDIKCWICYAFLSFHFKININSRSM